ncbi:DNA repair protein RecN [Muriicola sp. Z0-33]|uniref:DNA repair protein RecN n=1 Tax=Muriicola sp. Z0-33 TaxID=2816957 RepID=UPI002237CC10|nr:DNA repair protein RecN [Muriicola sp. Z0-33]MCW5516540.1 DNA repair protein RecN [Muriicola sp. Z0-33]
MLTQLSIKNYALINDLAVGFGPGFTTITGETGAGKSILLGALSLILGKRADLSVLQDKERKCIIEGEFDIARYSLSAFFKIHDLDYYDNSIVRREIHPGGKSRAFINDTPVTLDVLSQLGMQLVDVHSQHQTLRLTEQDFQLKVVDALAANKDVLSAYQEVYRIYQTTLKDLNQLIDSQHIAIKEYDYNSFLFKELESAPLQAGIQNDLEEAYEQLSNVETILEQLGNTSGLLLNEPVGILSMLSELKQSTNKLANFGSKYDQLNQRVQSVLIEANDIAAEIENLQESVEANPGELEKINSKLQLLYDLRRKHGVERIEELIAIKEALGEKIAVTEDLDTDIAQKREQLDGYTRDLENKAALLNSRRRDAIPKLIKQLEESLGTLGMPNATFKIEVETAANYKITGKDELVLRFSANKGADFGELKKVASGGELSRIMLVIKAIIAQSEQLPTMMFDEIDTGVSGEISNSMGDIMHKMSRNMQIFSITHLPQVAAKGDHHFKVYKQDDTHSTQTKMKELNEDERIVELAEMLGGKSISDAAMAHARELLN